MSAGVAERTAGRSRAARVTPLLIGAGVCLAGSIALHVRDPHASGSYGFCPWLLLTGTHCPGCGGLRAVNDLTHLRFADAASSNLLFVTALPLIAMLWTRSLVREWRGAVERRLLRPQVFAGLVATVLIGFWVLRNLPGLEWLRP